MKIAVITPVIGAPSETFIQKHMQELLPERTVAVATAYYPKGSVWNVNCEKFVFSEQTKNILYKGARYFKHNYNFGLDLSKLKLAKFLKANNVRYALIEYLNYSLGYISLLKELDIKIFAHAHGYDVSSLLLEKKWIDKYQELNNVSGIITMSNYSRDKLVNIGINEKNIAVIPYGIKVSSNEKTLNKKNIKCFAVGRMVNKKAPIYLLDSFRRAAEVVPDMTLDYIGTGSLYNAALQYINALGLENKVFLHGSQPNDEVLKKMSSADIFLQHSVTCPETGDQEGLPVAILEAMSLGLPVISTKHAGIPEAVQDGRTGFLVEEGDTIAMANKIVELAGNLELRREMGEEGKRRIKSNFTWEIERQKLLDLILGHSN